MLSFLNIRRDPNVDRDLGAVADGRRAAVQRAPVLLAIGHAVVEDDRSARLRLHLHIQPREDGVT